MITCLALSPALDVTYLVDRVAVGEIHRPRTVLTLPGGKALNAARAIVALGGSARAIVPLGGFAGARLRAELEAPSKEVMGRAVTRLEVVAVPTEHETRSCVTVYDDAGGTTEFYETTRELDDAAWASVIAALSALDGGWLAVSGSIPDARAVSLAVALDAAGGRGVSVAVDTHGAALREILARASPTLVKVNRSEAAALLGVGLADSDTGTLARALGARGVEIAIVTDGAAGAVATRAGAIWSCAPPETGRYAVGSGDCFLAGLLVAFDSSGTTDVAGALALATAAGAANTRVPGAAVFSSEVVRELRAAVIVTGGAHV